MSAKLVLQASNVKVSPKTEELTSVPTIVCIILPVYSSIGAGIAQSV